MPTTTGIPVSNLKYQVSGPKSQLSNPRFSYVVVKYHVLKLAELQYWFLIFSSCQILSDSQCYNCIYEHVCLNRVYISLRIVYHIRNRVRIHIRNQCRCRCRCVCPTLHEVTAGVGRPCACVCFAPPTHEQF